jgi:NADH-quinone oxidoreductase subunit E
VSAVVNSHRLLSDSAYALIDREVAKYPADQKQSAVMAALAIAQDEQGWVSPEVIEDVARYLGMPAIAVYEVATFYNMYDTSQPGQFKLAICTCLPCALRDGAKAGEYIKEKLGIDFNETTADGLFTLKESECLGACGDAPVLLVNNKRMCSFMSAEKIDVLIDELKSQARSQ